MKSEISRAVIIYNPNSTGDSEKNANDFAEKITFIPTTVIPTEYAGHAEKIARDIASELERVLIVSSSGDGGYNEVVNGVLAVEDSSAVVAVLPSGNANDHHSAMTSGNLVDSIRNVDIQKIEVIKVKAKVDGKQWKRYAHSYVGFGITPKVGRELTEKRLGAITEKWHVLYHLLKFKHVELLVDNQSIRLSSLVFATISKMSKIIKLEETAKPNDGLMEMYTTTYQSPWHLFGILVRGAFSRLSKSSRIEHFNFKTLRPTLIQLDGEVFTIDSETDVEIECEKDALSTIL